jgi:hypothetical protein
MRRVAPGLLLLVTLTLLVWAAPPVDQQVTLAWDASVDMVDGYYLYLGLASHVYTQRVDVGQVTTYTVTGLQRHTVYYAAASAYDRTANVESPLSNEVSTRTGPGGGQGR